MHGRFTEEKEDAFMTVEYTRYQVTEEQRNALERAYERAQRVLVASPHCLTMQELACDATFGTATV